MSDVAPDRVWFEDGRLVKFQIDEYTFHLGPGDERPFSGEYIHADVVTEVISQMARSTPADVQPEGEE